MIHQFAELGEFYRRQEGVGLAPEDRLTQFAQDPAQKFRTKTVLVLVFSENGFERVEVEQYDDKRRLAYLYRAGPANGCDATPTTGFGPAKKGNEAEFDDAVRKKLVRLSKSIADAIHVTEDLPGWETKALQLIRDCLNAGAQNAPPGGTGLLREILVGIKECHPPDSKEGAILTVAWRQSSGDLARVGDFQAFRRMLTDRGERAASSKKGIEGDVKGVGQCCICGKPDSEVFGLLQIPHFKLYTLDKPGSVSGGFRATEAWRNFPACQECCEKVDFAGERVKKHLTFDYYSSFKYLFLPLPLRSQPTLAFQLLNRLISFRLNDKAQKRLTAAQHELFYVVAQMEDNMLQVDLLFYQPDPQSFRPALYISGLLPSGFRALFQTKDRVDAHAWLQPPSPESFSKHQFSFGALNRVFPHAHGGSKFDDDFMAATRAALELRAFPASRMLQLGMRWVRQDYTDGKAWQYRLGDLFRSLLFFEELTNTEIHGSERTMSIDYGASPQGDRVRAVLKQASGKLKAEPAAQAAFLVGACCSRIETLQRHARGSSPFEGKLKGFRLSQADIQGLFVAAKDKAKAYGEGKVAGLLECAAAALSATPHQWPLSPDEVSYFFALGHALRPRFAGVKESDSDDNSQQE